MANIDRTIAANLWNALTISVDRFHAQLKRRENVQFLGFADITVDATRALPGMKLKLRGIEVKVLKGNPHIDMPSEKGQDGQYYPRYFPLTGELRAVLTSAIFQNPGVKAAVEQCAQLPVEGATSAPAAAATSASNPFSA